ncbi:hypothetical protein [Acetobacter estunensis]|uniref:hypothetical protein n=1 Tax=Acetobacter estunensis TaxID=104097 RepID=UPI001C2D3555|nr:hypothetical protein [Acetobacter estunensis]MBV1837164.1 hypothetical protein [Acetobacter estunensis]
MRAWQDDFWSTVSCKYGHTRSGPKRERLTRAEWKARQEEAIKIQRLKADIERDKSQMLPRFDLILQDIRDDLERRYRGQIERLIQQLQNEAKRADDAESRLAVLLSSVEEKPPPPEEGVNPP